VAGKVLGGGLQEEQQVDSQQIDALFDELRNRMRAPEYQGDIDAMIDVRNALTTWRKAGAQGPLPCEDELRSWGLLKDEAEPAITLEDLDRILQRLRRYSKERSDDDPEVDKMFESGARLREWRKSNLVGPMPDAERLAEWGVWPPAEAGDDVVVTLEAAAPQITAPPMPPDASAPHPAEAHRSRSSADPDDRYEGDYQAALGALQRKEFYRARGAFHKLSGLVTGRLEIPVEAGLSSAETELARATEGAIVQAQEIEKKAPKDLPRQEAAWHSVQTLNPDCDEALHALMLLGQRKADREIQKDIDDILPQAQKAAKTEQLPALNDLLGKVRGWKAKGEKQPSEISSDLYKDLVGIELAVAKLRDDARQKLGLASTLITSGNYRDAYQNGRDYLDRSVPTMMDQTGILGNAGSEVETPVFFKKIHQLFLGALQDLASQRIAEASGQEMHEPESAQKTLQDAIARLTDDVLTEDDKKELLPHLGKVQEKMRGVQDRLERYRQARKEILDAQAYGVKPAEALGKLRSARILYPDYPAIDTLITDVEKAVAEVIAGDVATAIARARNDIEARAFEEAAKTLGVARTQALEQVPHPPPDSTLVRRLTELEAVEKNLSEALGHHRKLMDTLSKVDGHFQAHKAGDAQALDRARNLLALLTSAEREDPDARDRLAELPLHQNLTENWQTGQAEYRQGNWPAAVAALQEVINKNGTNKAQAQLLVDRANARCRIQEADAAKLRGAWTEAIASYTEAKRLAETGKPEERDAVANSVLTQCQKALTELAPLQANDEEVGATLRKANDMLAAALDKTPYNWLSQFAHQTVAAGTANAGTNEFAEAANLLEDTQKKAKATFTTKGPDIDAQLKRVRDAWLQSFIEAINLATDSNDSEMLTGAMNLVAVLRISGLLYVPLHKAMALSMEERYLDTFYQQLVENSNATDWSKVEENRRKRLEAPHLRSQELEAEYRHAVHKRVEAEARNRQRQNLPGARDYLLQELQRPEMQGEESLYQLAIELCWKTQDWSAAENIARDIAIRNPALGDAWAGLTRAAQWFQNGFVAEGKIELALLRERYQQNSQVGMLIASKEDAFVRGALDTLIRSASSAMQKRTDDGYIEAAEKYAQAAELDGTDRRVQVGLGRLGELLGPGIQLRTTQAKGLRIGQRPLSEAVQEAERLYRTLDAIHKVAENLTLEVDTLNDLGSAVDELKPKLQRWKAVRDYLDKAAMARTDALRRPRSIGDSGAQGGWDFGQERAYLQQALQIAGRDKDTECQERVKGELEGLQRLEDRANKMHTHLTAFVMALRDEEFDVVMAEADQLTGFWDTYTKEDGWDGLDQLTAYRHPYQGQITKLDQHKQKAQDRKSNLEQWQSWSAEVISRYQSARKISTDLKKDLDELRQERSLGECVTYCRNSKRACEAFEEVLLGVPDVAPLSVKASAEQQKVLKDTWTRELLGENGYRVKAISMQQAAELDLEKLVMPLSRLQQIMTVQIEGYLAGHRREQSPPLNSMNLAQLALKTCQSIDPLHPEVTKYQRRLNELRSDGPRSK
jgi:hypothetical protein